MNARPRSVPKTLALLLAALLLAPLALPGAARAADPRPPRADSLVERAKRRTPEALERDAEARRRRIRELLARRSIERTPDVTPSRRTLGTALATAVALAPAAAPAAAPARTATGTRAVLQTRITPFERTYLIGARDLLSVTIFTQDRSVQAEDPTLELPVNAAGFVSLPLVGKVKAEGRTPVELEGELTRRFQRFVKEPQVSVHVKEHRARRVFVVGQVNQNGPVYIEHEDTTLFEVISRAGGFVNSFGDSLEGADARNVIVERGGKKIVVDFYGDATQERVALNFLVQDGDQVFVPKPLNRVQVLGGVREAKEIELKPGMTLLEAVAKAGSFTERSRRDQVRIIRRGGGKENTLHVDATRIFHGRTPDVELEPGDVVYVSEW